MAAAAAAVLVGAELHGLLCVYVCIFFSLIYYSIVWCVSFRIVFFLRVFGVCCLCIVAFPFVSGGGEVCDCFYRNMFILFFNSNQTAVEWLPNCFWSSCFAIVLGMSMLLRIVSLTPFWSVFFSFLLVIWSSSDK